MRRIKPLSTSLVILCFCLFTSASQAATFIHDVRMFDGEKVIDSVHVLIDNGVIEEVSATKPSGIPDDATIINGAGMTLLPGFIDAHTHTFSRAMLERSLDFGVTTSIDMGTAPEFAQVMKQEQSQATVYDRADLVSAGWGVTVPGGHGTQFGMEVPTLGESDNEDAFVAARLEEGSEFIKMVVDDFSVVGFDMPTLSESQANAVVRAAHDRGHMAVVHARDHEGYMAATRAGVDGFVHGLSESAPQAELLQLMSKHKPFVIPTLTTTEGTQGGPGGAEFAQDPVIGPMLSDREKGALSRVRFENPRVEFDFSIALNSTLAFFRNGSMILAGTDSPNPGTTPGASIHRELELLVEAGMPPTEALKAATANGASAFGLNDRGRIANGLKADLILVDGNPAESITDTRNIKGIWKAGKQVQ